MQQGYKVSNLIMKFFQCSVRNMPTRGKLWPLALCLFATLLMYLPEMRSRYPNRGVLHVLLEKSQECDIRLGQLLEWSKMVMVRFDHRNIMEATLDEGQSLIPVLLEPIVILEKNAKASHEVCTNLVDTTIQLMSGLLHDIDCIVSNSNYTANTRSAPRSSVAGRKRLVEESSVTAEIDATDNIIPSVPVVLFTDRFRHATDRYNSLTLSSKPIEAFLYDWYEKCLGVTKGSTIVLTASLWASAVGNKVSVIRVMLN